MYTRNVVIEKAKHVSECFVSIIQCRYVVLCQTENVVVAKGLDGVILDYLMGLVTGSTSSEDVNENESNKILDGV